MINTALELLAGIAHFSKMVKPFLDNEQQDLGPRSRGYSASTFSLASADQREEGPSPPPTSSPFNHNP